MEEHPLCEQGDACPAIRLPLQQCEAMEKAFRWPVAPRQSEPCLYGRLLFVQSGAHACSSGSPCCSTSSSHPAADLLGVDAADDTRPPLGLPCEPATRRLGSAAPTGCETCGMFDGSTLAGSFNTRACPRTRVQTSSLSRKREAMKHALKPDCC